MTQPPPPPPYGTPPAYPPIAPPPAWFPAPPPPRRSRVLPVVLAVVAAIALVAAAVLVPLLLSGDDDGATAGDSDDEDTSSVDTSDLAAVRTYDDLTYQHLPLGEDHDYPQSPAVGGDHAPVWIECGAYDEPLPEVGAVHDLEHGSTWITYRPDDVDDDGVDRLEEQLPANGLLSPYPDQAAPVVITVWGRQLDLTGPEDPRIALFIAEYGAGSTAPEPYASCNGGVDPAELADLTGRADPVA
ncbi:hypothetical protein BJ993_004166 [Nocardioides aromaticivorans]|uniref:DUF3105 domain-containing protein n=1 Tax=Nocardioides aromaticivorans TaxID=200618 RepID=A0A7Z0CMS0_9ACTN|nr:DUF3105 domain-containing protein [Nocardioides aromaticivorans]NYI47086.1 hypothetical protein [Nocardioides aromaticivorans]